MICRDPEEEAAEAVDLAAVAEAIAVAADLVAVIMVAALEVRAGPDVLIMADLVGDSDVPTTVDSAADALESFCSPSYSSWLRHWSCSR